MPVQPVRGRPVGLGDRVPVQAVNHARAALGARGRRVGVLLVVPYVRVPDHRTHVTVHRVVGRTADERVHDVWEKGVVGRRVRGPRTLDEGHGLGLVHPGSLEDPSRARVGHDASPDRACHAGDVHEPPPITAVMVGTGKAAQLGILIKDAKALEFARNLQVLIFDKTGTLTVGKPSVTDLMVPEKYHSLLYSIEKHSHHPLADAIVSHFSKNAKEVTITDFKDIVGKGIKASYKNINVLVGTHSFMKDEHINISSQIEEKANDLRKVGKTVSFVAVNRDVIGLVALADTLKKESFETIQKLKQMGIRTIMMTGDNKITAQTIGDELQIDEVIAEVMPQDKASKVKEVQTEGVKRMIVGMVGDGINDAPAMAQSDIGIAMGTGTDVAVATGDIVIVGGSIEKVLESIDLSRKTLQIIKQNLFWAFLYNIIGIPVAAGILYPFMSILLSPILASLAMALSSVSVVGNSLRLKYLT